MFKLDNVDKLAINERMNEQAKKLIEMYESGVQIQTALEELSELITAILHNNRGKNKLEDVISEICDVEMMITSLKYIYCNNSKEYFDMLESKLDKQEEYLK